MEQTSDSIRLGAAGIVALVISGLLIAVLSLPPVAGVGQRLTHLVAGVVALALSWRLTRRRRGLVQLLVIPLATLLGLLVGSIAYDFVKWFG